MSTLKQCPTNLLNTLHLGVFRVSIERLEYAFFGSSSVGSVVVVFLGAVLVYGLLRLVYRGQLGRIRSGGCDWFRSVSSLLSFSTAYRRYLGTTVIDMLSTLLSLIALWLLFTTPSNTWFRAHRAPKSK